MLLKSRHVFNLALKNKAWAKKSSSQIPIILRIQGEYILHVVVILTLVSKSWVLHGFQINREFNLKKRKEGTFQGNHVYNIQHLLH
jgi:hypothetical protein